MNESRSYFQVIKYKVEDNNFVYDFSNPKDEVSLFHSLYLGDENHWYQADVTDVLDEVIYHTNAPVSFGVVGGTPDTFWHSKAVVSVGEEYSFTHTFWTEHDLYNDWRFFERVFEACGYVVEKLE